MSRLKNPYYRHNLTQFRYEKAAGHLFRFSSLLLAVYTFSVIVISKSPELKDFSKGIGLALAYLFIVEFLVSRQPRLQWPKELISLTIFFLVLLAGSLWAAQTKQAITHALTYFQLLIFALVALNIVLFRKDIVPIVGGALAGIVVTAYDVWQSNGFGFEAQRRAFGLLQNPNFYAITLVIGGLLCIYLYQRFSQIYIRIGLVCLTVFFAHQVIFYTGSRKGLLGILIAGVFFILINQLQKSKFLLGRLFLVSIVLLIGFSFGAEVVERSVFGARYALGTQDATTQTRMQMVKVGINLWEEKPVVGHGTGQYRFLYNGVSYSHNNYVELLANNGIIGLFAYYAFYFVVMKKAISNYQRNGSSFFQLAWILTTIFILLMWDFAMVSYYEKLIWIVYILLIAMCSDPMNLDTEM